MALADFDLMLGYAVYLGFALTVSLIVRARYYYALVNIFWDLRNRLPNLFKVMVGNVHLFLAWPHLLAITAALTIFGTHMILYTYVFADAYLPVATVAAHIPTLLVVSATLLVLMAMDVYALFIAEQPSPPRIRLTMLLAERGLASKGPMSLLSRGLISRYMRRRILKTTLVVNPWFHLWARRMVARTVVGTLLWLVWALRAAP